MIKVWDKIKDKYLNVFSIKESKDKSYFEVQFSEGSKPYRFKKERLQLDNNTVLNIYTYEIDCWRCHHKVDLLTYMVYKKDPSSNLELPLTNKGWNKLQIFEDIQAHMQYSEIEFYSIFVLGDIPKYDQLLLEKYPKRIKEKYSKTTQSVYAMNLCPKCKANTGHFFLYKQANKLIQKEEGIKKVDEIAL